MGDKRDSLNIGRSNHKIHCDNAHKKQNEIENDSNRIIEEINAKIGTINSHKIKTLENLKIIFSFLVQFGTPDQKVPSIKELKEEVSPAKEKITEIKTTVQSRPEPSLGKVGKTIIDDEKFFNEEKTGWDRIITECETENKKLRNYLTIVSLYCDVVSSIRQAVEDIIIKEIPGIEAYLYARGVKDAIASDKLPSESRPISIDKLKNSPSEVVKSHYCFFQNTVDFYTFMYNFYKNNYLKQTICLKRIIRFVPRSHDPSDAFLENDS